MHRTLTHFSWLCWGMIIELINNFNHNLLLITSSLTSSIYSFISSLATHYFSPSFLLFRIYIFSCNCCWWTWLFKMNLKLDTLTRAATLNSSSQHLDTFNLYLRVKDYFIKIFSYFLKKNKQTFKSLLQQTEIWNILFVIVCTVNIEYKQCNCTQVISI